jgi:hypothetical protein
MRPWNIWGVGVSSRDLAAELKSFNEHRGRLASTPAAYSAGPVFVVYLGSSSQILTLYRLISHLSESSAVIRS